MYNLLLDQNKIFQCKLKVEGASLQKSKVRLVFETEKFDLKFNGEIDDDGTVNIPISKLKGVLEENTKGNLYIEVVADDVYFIPYESEYITELSRKVEVVSVNESFSGKEKVISSKVNKPVVTVTTDNTTEEKNSTAHAKSIISEMRECKISLFKKEDKEKIVTLVGKYIIEHKLSDDMSKSVMTDILDIIKSTMVSQ